MKGVYLFILFASINFLAYTQSNQYDDLLAVNGTTTATGQMSPLATFLLAIGLIALGLGVSYFLMRDEINLPSDISYLPEANKGNINNLRSDTFYGFSHDNTHQESQAL